MKMKQFALTFAFLFFFSAFTDYTVAGTIYSKVKTGKELISDPSVVFPLYTPVVEGDSARFPESQYNEKLIEFDLFSLHDFTNVVITIVVSMTSPSNGNTGHHYDPRFHISDGNIAPQAQLHNEGRSTINNKVDISSTKVTGDGIPDGDPPPAGEEMITTGGPFIFRGDTFEATMIFTIENDNTNIDITYGGQNGNGDRSTAKGILNSESTLKFILSSDGDHHGNPILEPGPDYIVDFLSVTAVGNPVPEPSSLGLIVMAGVGLLARRRVLNAA